MRKLTMYLGFALAACLSCFSFAASALTEPSGHVYRAITKLAELPAVGVKRLELTLSMWRTGSQDEHDDLASNLRASSNHFVMVSAKPSPDGVGLTPC
ncbi:hypothetical protein V2I84_05210 [Pseudomonas viridiflava]|uniref:hypothetical protein n=1 Tax=Pseudomonas viridiflava TaxID=33069 RepID=UPI002EB84DA5|nr:hypothetical protein [Pseudomonas viridiflava]MEE3980853.1 hypothetical protein [Pseudomonas viridiflava]MEE3989587.1 hypothetical protein [Pseudomonas viridiflava]MEE4028133.1 hypothetical protein [Pseudomonas viridiflava]MEE4034297.1 hypothetical protein [Pseudomonas viridiflava]